MVKLSLVLCMVGFVACGDPENIEEVEDIASITEAVGNGAALCTYDAGLDECPKNKICSPDNICVPKRKNGGPHHPIK